MIQYYITIADIINENLSSKWLMSCFFLRQTSVLMIWTESCAFDQFFFMSLKMGDGGYFKTVPIGNRVQCHMSEKHLEKKEVSLSLW